MPEDYDDDDRRDEADDRPRRPRRRERNADYDIEDAKAKTQTPAIFLIIVAVLSLIGAVYGLALGPQQFEQSMKLQVEMLEKNQQIPAQQKQAQIQMMKNISDTMKTWLIPIYAISGVGGLLTLWAGISFMKLKSRGIVITGSILSMLPLTGGCCCLGLPIGIWVIVVLNNPVVRAGYAAASQSSRPLDDREDY